MQQQNSKDGQATKTETTKPEVNGAPVVAKEVQAEKMPSAQPQIAQPGVGPDFEKEDSGIIPKENSFPNYMEESKPLEIPQDLTH